MKRARRQHRSVPVSTVTTQARRSVSFTVEPSKPRNPVARSPLLGKGGVHGKSTGALRRKARMDLAKLPQEELPE